MLKHQHSQKGFTLIEILVAVVVLSIGLLGLAGLQARSLQFNKSAEQRSQATILAYDIIDRMRANRALAEAGSYDLALGTGPGATVNCETGTCSTANLATYDLNQWLCLLGSWDASAACGNFGIEGLLLEGDGAVVRAGNTVTVTIRWTDDRSNVDDATVNQSTSRLTQINVSTIL
jgi:type IV pilus assembly protein PilV